MYCMNLCHSRVVWKYYTGLMLIVGILAFGVGAHAERIPLGCSFLMTKYMFGGVSSRTKSAMILMMYRWMCHI